MLSLLWHLRGSVPLAGAGSDAELLDRLEALLDAQQKPVSERGAHHLAFDDPLWGNMRFSSDERWLAFVAYDQGRFRIERGLDGARLQYDLRSLHGLIFCLLVAAVAFALGCLDGDVSRGVTFAAAAFAWL